MTISERVWAILRRPARADVAYEPLEDDSDAAPRARPQAAPRAGCFSWIEYGVFLLLGVAMLWAWNMFLAAAPYLQYRFRHNQAILQNFQATELATSTITNLGSMLILTKLQANARYPRRIILSLAINVVTFTLLALSTKLFLGISSGAYFAFIILTILASSLATGFMQNGIFAYVATFQRSEYVQAIMFGQAIAGILPPIVQLVSTLSASQDFGDDETDPSSDTAFSYFLTATGVSAAALVAFFYLLAHHRPAASAQGPPPAAPIYTDDESQTVPDATFIPDGPSTKSTSLTYLSRALFFPASAVFLTFAVTMVFPVFTQEIFSTNPHPPRFLRDAAFIPLALLIWNAGDLTGRLLPLVPQLSLASKPRILLSLSIARFVFIPLYLICNIRKPEHASALGLPPMPDLFYFAVVQFPFGLTSGFLGTCCMTGAGACVREGEQEAAGSFMGLCLVGGLAVGSVASFFVGGL